MDEPRMDEPGTKRALRRAAIARRKTVPAADRTAAGAMVARHARALFDGLEAGATVAAYVPMGSEIRIEPLLEDALARGLRLLVPMLGTGMEVGWGVLETLDDLAVAGDGHGRPEEPAEAETLGMEALRDAAVVIVPALAVDASGTRLGRGGGWYDRALAHVSPDAPLVAVCWPWEMLPDGADPLPREPHDLPVDGVVTPEGLTMFGKE
ncbi:5-formyltetrahydrofolate cyclo-ligase [Bifidobacterium saguinibicoloris]|uniref:5-formyltetrahydrofolate cyclo-ligase n=1 Tax=Bifidobacterium saguinibicoloris TaxID=2834433 RepID=UPI001F3A66C7|nr:5-formyltetrahydrofolate cyclo-ligase [Bifidobacterium saguinibicoloris]